MFSGLLKIFAGAAAVAALAAAAIGVGGLPGSSASAVKKLQTSAEKALGTDALTWAHVEMVGQTAILTGAAPDQAALDAAKARVAAAAGEGGPVLGGVTMIDSRGLNVAEPPAGALLPDADAAPASPPVPPLRSDAAAKESAETDQGAGAAGALPAEPPIAEAGIHVADDRPPSPSLAPAKMAMAESACISAVETAASSHVIRFVSARIDLDAPSRDYLRRVAEAVADCPAARLVITGHTDSSGSRARNLELSANRAAAVRSFLISVGAPEVQIDARGAGSSEPVASNRTPEGRAQNRRIEITVSQRG